ncbi:MAG: helix-turn-helix domain-containing protein, partial [Candidatus Alectryocaccobium sp.]
YEYYGEDKTEVYWIHFTGSNVKNILRQYGFPDKERVFQVGTSNEYEQIFKRIIIEFQRCQDNYEEMLVLLLRHLLISFHRELTRDHILKNEYLDHEMDNAVTFFSENYNQNINIDDYAASRGMSVSWFIRNFKKYTGSTPMQFIVEIRINNAQMLLETTTYSINEISKIVGYDNQLYFSRLFHKLKGYSPREYRKIRNKL